MADLPFVIDRMIDARCVGQGAFMPVMLTRPPWPSDDRSVIAMITDAFVAAYRLRYKRTPPSVPIDLVHIRTVISGERPSIPPAMPRKTEGETMTHTRLARFGGAAIETTVFERAALLAGFQAQGPALVEEAGSTLVVGPEGRFSVLPSGSILVEIG